MTLLLLVAVMGSAAGRAQGVLNTEPGLGFTSQQVSVQFGRDLVSPMLLLRFGFSTDEIVRAGEIADSFTISLVDDQGGLALVLVTADAGGVVWAPETPGTTPVARDSIVAAAIEYPSLTPVLANPLAYAIEVALTDEVLDRPLTLYFDLFSNDNDIASQAWFSEVTVVPEPTTVALLAVGLAVVVWCGRRRGSGPGCQGILLALVAAGFWSDARAQSGEKVFRWNNAELTLAEVTPETAVYFRSMRLNRALDVWNVEVTVSNRSGRILNGPLVLLVDSYSGTPGPVGPDGLDDSQPSKAFFDLSGRTTDGTLAPGGVTAPRTLTLGRSGTAPPAVETRVFAARVPVVSALGLTRSLDEVGRPLPAVGLSVEGPAGTGVQTSDSPSGVASLGQGPGEHRMVFSADGYFPVWRRQTLTEGRTTLIPNPRLTRRQDAGVVATPLDRVVLSNASGSIRIEIPAGAVNQSTTLGLTPLTGQTLPAFLPQGWSPLGAFWLESSGPLPGSVAVSLVPDGPIAPTELAALVTWNPAALEWRVVQVTPGNGTNALAVGVPGPGSYALVVGDHGLLAPPAPQPGQALQPSAAPLPGSDGLTATGTVTPSASPASVVPEEVTGAAEVVVSHISAALPSGTLFRGEVTETYLPLDGSLRLTPQYEHFIVGYQRPGDNDVRTLHARFPMRPTLLLGPDRLDTATVRVDVLPEQPFDGRVLDASGGQIGSEGVRVVAGSGRLTGPSAFRLRRLDAMVFTNLPATGHSVVAVFELTVDRSTLADTLAAQLSGAPTNGLFVLARVLSDTGFFGLQPIERLESDGQGNLLSREPASGERLPGLEGSGQYVLVQVDAAQSLVSGVARNGAGALQAGMPVSLTGFPWLTLTDTQGRYQLVAPAGPGQLQVRDPRTGDAGLADLVVADPTVPISQDLDAAPRGPRVAAITPAHEAIRVPRVGSVVITFNEAVNPATVVNAIELLRPDNSVVPAAVTLNLANRVVTLSPANELPANTTYRLRLAPTVADPGGLPIEGPTEFTFTTAPLSTRDPAAQLIIYEPGATNVPVAILDAIPAYEPGDDPSAIVVHGTPGAADPEVPVILVNESTGETATILSKPDGSFASVISGSEQDFVSATFVNLNGTRVYVPVSRQHFDNGFVGLYPQGGILEAQSDGGPVQVLIKPNAVPNRTKFRIKTLNRAQLLEATGGVTPDVATLGPGAMRIELEGSMPTEPMEVSFPLNLDALGYPADASPSELAAALVRVRDTDGIKTFEVLDQMRFEAGAVAGMMSGPAASRSLQPAGFPDIRVGTVTTVLGFYPSLTVGLVAPLLIDYVIMPMILGQRPVIVHGVTQFLATNEKIPPSNMLETFSDAVVTSVTESIQAGRTVNPVAGAYVILRSESSPVSPLPGRLLPGNVHATSNRDGTYSLLAPSAAEQYILMATHPGYSDRPAAEFKASVDLRPSGVFKRLIFHTRNASDVPVRFNFSHAPQFPAPGQDCEVRISAFRGYGAPPDIQVRLLSLTNLVTGEAAPASDLVITNVTGFTNATSRVWSGILRAGQPVQAVLRVESDGRTSRYPIQFSGTIPPVITGPLPKPDTNDVHGPIVIATVPPDGGFLGPSGEIEILFNKPLDRQIEASSYGITLEGASVPRDPVVRLKPGQKSLVIQYAGLEPAREYTLNLTGQAVRDLAGQPLDQRPSTPEPDGFRLVFQTAPVRIRNLPGLVNGRGTVIRGETLYAIDSGGAYPALRTYDIRDPGQPALVASDSLFGQPRDLLVIPQYAYRRSAQEPPVTNDLVVVVGGDLDTRIDEINNTIVRGQYLSIFEASDSSNPGRLVPLLPSAILSYRVGSAITKVRWAPPNLVYQEFGADIHQLGVINLQSMVIGFRNPVLGESRGGRPGVDLNGDGDYVDTDEVVPLPEHPPAEFYGKEFAHVLFRTTQKILDFSPLGGGQFVGVTLTRGQMRNDLGALGERLPPSYRTLAINLPIEDPQDSVFPFNDLAYPRWVTVFPSLVILSNDVPIQPTVAIVSLQPDSDGIQKLAILDISLPQSPRLISKVPVPPEALGGSVQSVRLRSDGLLEVAGDQHLVLLDPLKLAVTNIPLGQAHPAVAGFIPSAGASTRSLGSTPVGYRSVADGGRGVLVQTGPELRFVSFPIQPQVVSPAGFIGKTDEELAALMQGARITPVLPPARARAFKSAGIASDLDPPRPAAHFHVWMEAPGATGERIELGLESINHAGRPLGNLGDGFAPVRAISEFAQEGIGQKPRPDCGAPIRSLTAWRLSDDPLSPFYNQYLSRPFAMLANETLSVEEQARLQQILDREILHSGAGLRAFIDPSEAENPVVGLFAARVDSGRRRLAPVASHQALTLFHPYLMGNNPPPAGAYVTIPGTFGSIGAHSGEFRTEATDLELPSPRMPITIERSIGNQDSYEGPFGVGWDFNYNQRITELSPLTIPVGLQIPLIVRASRDSSEIAGSQDVLFQTGRGRVLHFRWVSTNMPPEYSQDPLVSDYGYLDTVSDYYLPAEGQGLFNLLVKFRDGRFERLSHDGVRHRYGPDGRLEMVIDRFPLNRHVLEYDSNGWLVRIDDRSVREPRYVEFGYYRSLADPGFQEGLDERTDNAYLQGKVRRLRDYAAREVLYGYSDDGFLLQREGIRVNGENSGFSGRPLIQYNYANCRIVGVSTGREGTPLFNADVSIGPAGKAVARAGTGTSPMVISIPDDNSAATMEGQKSTGTEADGRSTEVTFNSFGQPTSYRVVGGQGEESESKPEYNPMGLLVKIQYPEGRVETRTYDEGNPIFRSRGNLLRVTVDPGPRGGEGYTETQEFDPRYNLPSGEHLDANGFAHVFSLNDDGRVIASIRHGPSETETFTYNSRGQLTSNTDVRGVRSGAVYDEATGFTRRTTVGDHATRYEYGNDSASRLGHPSVVTPPVGFPTHFHYSPALQILESGRGTSVIRHGYDERGNEIRTEEELGDGQVLVTRRTFHPRGFMLEQTSDGVDVNGQSSSITWRYAPDKNFRVATVHHPGGAVQSFEYDQHDQVTKMTLGTYVEVYRRDRHGNVIETWEGGEIVTTFSYDGMDRVTSVVSRTGAAEEASLTEYFPGGQVRKMTTVDPKFGVVAEQAIPSIDALGRPKQALVQGGVISPRSEYNYAPLRSTVVGPRMTVQAQWNDSGDMVKTESPIASAEMYPDSGGRLERVDHLEDGVTYRVSTSFNGLDQVETESDLEGLLVRYIPRADGRNASVINARNHANTFNYTVLGEPLQRRRSDGLEFRYRYDSQREVIYTGDPSSGFAYAYDDEFRLTEQRQRNGDVVSQSDFDPRQMPRKTSLPGGGTVETDYDLKRRPIRRATAFQGTRFDEEYQYDALDRIRSSFYGQDGGAQNVHTSTYDRSGVLLISRWQEAGGDFAIHCNYNEDGSRRSVIYPSGHEVTEDRDVSGRLIGVSDNSGNILSVNSWRGLNQPAEVFIGSGIRQVNQFDARGRMTASRFTRRDDGVVLAHLRWEYNAVNNPVAQQFLHRGGRADRFSYDEGERLQSAAIGVIPGEGEDAQGGLYEREYRYDPAGLDLLLSSAATGAVSEPPGFATNWSGHGQFLEPMRVDGFDRGPADPLGRVARAELLIRESGAGSGSRAPASLVHNGRGDLVRIDFGDGRMVEYEYQAEGLRYLRRVTRDGLLLELRHFVYDDRNRLLEEYDRSEGEAALVGRYYYGNGDAPVAADIREGQNGPLLRYYYLRDVADSVIAVADAEGRVLERVWYDPFGQPVLEGADAVAPSIVSIASEDSGALRVVLSEPVMAPIADPGEGTGIVPIPLLDGNNVLSVSIDSTPIPGTTEVLLEATGSFPYSVLRFTPSEPLPVTPTGVLGWWPGDAEVSEVISGHRGILRGGATAAPGLNQQSFVFRGDGAHAEITNAAAFNLGGGDFTLSVWSRFHKLAGDQVLVEKWTQATRAGWSLFKTADHRLRLVLGNGSGNEISVESSPMDFATNVWIQVGARRQGEQFALFTNGVVVAARDAGISLSSTATLKFGSREGTGAYLVADLDEVVLHGRALSDQEITAIAGGVTLPGPVTVAITGGVLADEWGNRNDPAVVSFLPVGTPGIPYYRSIPEPHTAPPQLAQSSVESPFLFHGQYFDYGTGLIYLRARYYDPLSGMFLEPDPLGYEDSVNLYAGMRNNPVGIRDPSGLSGGVLGVVRNLLRGGNQVAKVAPEVSTFVPKSNPEGLGSVILSNLGRSDPLDTIFKSTLASIIRRTKLESGFLGIVKPMAKNLDMSLKDAYIAIAQSDDFARAIEKYNRYAEKWGLTKSVDQQTVIEQLKHNTFFARTDNSVGALWDHSELGKIGKYWMQGNPHAGFGIPAFATGRQTAIHEMLHMGASIGGQVTQLRAAKASSRWSLVGNWRHSRLMNAHENAVQLSSTPGTYLAMTGLKLGAGGIGAVLLYNAPDQYGRLMRWREAYEDIDRADSDARYLYGMDKARKRKREMELRR
ncbi:MAG: Ig-like domain-containing protein [Verrucomicrobiae bacterium]|nr:Ig-like domain-containing protein [Verrucomicrobiae bacterium]